MRFSCEHCGKKYVVKDDLLPGRTYRSRCKVCGLVMVVKGEAPGAADPAAPTPPTQAPPTPRSSLPTTELPAPPREESGYIDLFDGKGFDESAPPSAGFPDEPVRRTGATRTPPPPSPSAPAPTPPAAVLPPPTPRPAGPQREPPRAAAPAPAPAPSAPPAGRPQGTATLPRVPPPAPPRRSFKLLVAAGAGALLLGALTVGAVLRPWRSVPPRSAEAPAAPTPPAEPPRAEAPPAAQPPAAAVAPPPPAPQPAAAAPAAEPPASAEAQPAPEPEPAPAVADRKRPEALSAAAIRKVLAAARKPFDRCLEDPSRGLEKPLPAHRVSLRLSVEPAGNVAGVAISDPAVARAPVGQCLKAAALKLAFPPFRGSTTQVEAPVNIPASPAPAAAPAVAKVEPPPVTPAKVEAPPPPKAEPPPVIPAKVEAAPLPPPKAEPPPAPEPPPAADPAGPAFVAVEFAASNRARSGGEIGDTRYSQNPDDAEITDRSYSDGVVTYAGQLGRGHGSSYAGIGFWVNVRPGGTAIDASKYRTVAIKLASSTTPRLRVRLQGTDQSVLHAGCYPIVVVSVSENMKTYRLKLSDFTPENYCGAKGRSPEDTLPQLTGFEVADTTMQGRPTKFSVGTITLYP